MDNFFLREGDFKREKKRKKKVVKNGVSQPHSAVTAFKTAFALRMYIYVYICVCVYAHLSPLLTIAKHVHGLKSLFSKHVSHT